MLNPAQQLGAQGYFQITHFGEGDDAIGAGVDTLDIFDLGVAGVQALLRPRGARLCLTPLAGVQLALLSPDDQIDGDGSQVFNYARSASALELGAVVRVRHRYEHVLSAIGRRQRATRRRSREPDGRLADRRGRAASIRAARSATSASATRTGSTRRSAARRS